MKRSYWILLISIVTAAFWYIARTVNVYNHAFLGGLYEFLSLFMLAALFILPLISVFCWTKEKFRLRSLYPITLLINITVLLFVFLPS